MTTIRSMLAQEASLAAEITRLCPEAAQWSEANYVSIAAGAESSTRVIVAVEHDRVIGFLAFRIVSDELEVLNLGVSPTVRMKGVGTALMEAALALAMASGARAAFCEVRESNLGAQTFYARHGFQRTGRRLRYYRDPVEDAIVLMKSGLGDLPAGNSDLEQKSY